MSGCACVDGDVRVGSLRFGNKYTYSDVSVESSGFLSSMDDSSKTMYDEIYKDFVITVSDSKIVWKISDNENVMSVKKDGEKYILSGDYADQMKKALSAGGLGNTTWEMYGLETEEGFDIVMTISISITVVGTTSTSETKLTINFAK